jgi:cytochrome P450
VRARLYLDEIKCFRTFAECSKLPYLDAVICESLRFSPSIGAVLTREVLKGGAEILPGDVVPSGTIIGVNNWVMGRSQDIYGADAEDFKPERWLNEANREKYKEYDFAFGYGARM